MLRSASLPAWLRVAPLVALVPACVVSFNDYPVGDLRGTLPKGGESNGGTGSGGVSGGLGTGNDGTLPSSGTSSGGSEGTAGSGASGGSGTSGTAGTAGSDALGGSGGGSGGTSAVGMAGEAGSGQAGAPSVEPVTVEITDLVDTYVSENSPGTNYGNEPTLIMDRNTGMGGWGQGDGRAHEALLRASLTALPAGAVVSAATLTLKCSRVGDPIQVTYAEEEWQEAGVNWYNQPAVGAVLGNVSGDATLTLSIDLQAAVSAWLAGDHDNFGVHLALGPDGLDATECASSEAADPRQRPRLSVTFTVP